MEGSTRRRRDTGRPVLSRNVDSSAADRQKTVGPGSQRRRASQNDIERRRRHRHHSINEAITSLDVRLPLRVGQDAARPVQGSVAGLSASSSGNAVDVGREKAPPVAIVVEDRPAADQPDRDRHPPQPRLVDLTARKTRRNTSVGVDLRRLGRRCRSLENVHKLPGAADSRAYALLTTAN